MTNDYIPMLKKPEIKRDEKGMFERHGKELAKTAKNTMAKRVTNNIIENIPVEKRGPGRPPGSQNKVTVALKDMILRALDKAGGEDYLAKLAVENSSAFASLIGKVLPTTLHAQDDGHSKTVITFKRIIVHPNGHQEIEGVTPKALPAPQMIELSADDPRVKALPNSKPRCGNAYCDGGGDCPQCRSGDHRNSGYSSEVSGEELSAAPERAHVESSRGADGLNAPDAITDDYADD